MCNTRLSAAAWTSVFKRDARFGCIFIAGTIVIMGKNNKKKRTKPDIIGNDHKREQLTNFPRLVANSRTNRFLSVEELHQGDPIYVSRNFFDDSESLQFVQSAEQIGFEYVCHPSSKYVAHRECGRISRGDGELARAIFERAKPLLEYISDKWGDLMPGKRSIGCNPNIRLYKYEKGMSFGRHIDSSDDIAEMKGRTQVTALIYLSTCVGGSTRFYPPHGKRKTGFAFEPFAGTILLHVHGDRYVAVIVSFVHACRHVDGASKVRSCTLVSCCLAHSLPLNNFYILIHLVHHLDVLNMKPIP